MWNALKYAVSQGLSLTVDAQIAVVDEYNGLSQAARLVFLRTLRKYATRHSGGTTIAAVTILDALIKNTGIAWMVNVCPKFLPRLAEAAMKPSASVQFRGAVLDRIEDWGVQFKDRDGLDGFVQMYNHLRTRGAPFPSARLEADLLLPLERVPIFDSLPPSRLLSDAQRDVAFLEGLPVSVAIKPGQYGPLLAASAQRLQAFLSRVEEDGGGEVTCDPALLRRITALLELGFLSHGAGLVPQSGSGGGDGVVCGPSPPPLPPTSADGGAIPYPPTPGTTAIPATHNTPPATTKPSNTSRCVRLVLDPSPPPCRPHNHLVKHRIIQPSEEEMEFTPRRPLRSLNGHHSKVASPPHAGGTGVIDTVAVGEAAASGRA